MGGRKVAWFQSPGLKLDGIRFHCTHKVRLRRNWLGTMQEGIIAPARSRRKAPAEHMQTSSIGTKGDKLYCRRMYFPSDQMHNSMMRGRKPSTEDNDLGLRSTGNRNIEHATSRVDNP